MSNTSFLLKLPPRDWKSETLLGKELQIYVAENFPKFKKSCFGETMRKNLCVGVILYKIAGRDWELENILKRSFHRGDIPINTSEFSVLLHKGPTYTT